MPRSLLVLVGIIVGAVLTVQAGVNAQLRFFVGSPFRSAWVNFTVGMLTLGCIVLLTRAEPTAIRQSSWWMWIGGMLGSVYVVGSVVLAPRLGATTLAATIVSGQLIAAVILDHFGWVGYRGVPITWQRLLGVALLLAGVLLVQRR